MMTIRAGADRKNMLRVWNSRWEFTRLRSDQSGADVESGSVVQVK